MKWTKFGSIENTYREDEIQRVLEYGYDAYKFFATEKIHGSNASFITDGKNIKMARKNSMIEDNSNWMNLREIRDLNSMNIIQIFQRCQRFFGIYNLISNIVIYGEVFGGFYNHKDVLKDTKAIKVQKKIQYSPQNEFFVFDIKIFFKDGNERYLDIVDAISITRLAGMCFVPILYAGTFQSCLEYPVIFQTFVPKMLGYPVLEDNEAEGVVIRPEKECRFGNGSRVILKNKNPKFSEKIKQPKEKKPKILSYEGAAVFSVLLDYITENRLRNVISKFGEITNKDFTNLLSDFMRDIFEDYMKENNENKNLNKEERNNVNKLVSKKAADIIRRNFVDIINGDF